jgi:hypothetical protein
MADVEYERGANELPQGAAAAANETAASVPTAPDFPVAPVNDIPMPELGDEEPDYAPKDEREALLYAPAEGRGRDMPDGPVTPKRVPVEVVRKLPALQRAAQRSDAPPSLVALYRMTVRGLEDEMREHG